MLTIKEMEKRLGFTPGPTLVELAKRAYETSSALPSHAFAKLWFILPWLDAKYDGYNTCFGGSGTPKNVKAFAFTGGDLVHFGFLTAPDLENEESPIVCIDPGDHAQIVAPNLRAFLGLLSIAFGEVMGKHTNEHWFAFRQKWYGNEPDHLQEMERLSQTILTIPGVTRPSDPERIVKMTADITFELSWD
ncbi:hypothetical protein SAMN05518672_101885 [Chitinophaga sp. CF118]|nr:hypothetical protein SAMN05518672_101885 [Chitinophaga sp. CF118]